MVHFKFRCITSKILSITDFIVSKDVRVIFQGHIEKRNSKSPQSFFSFLVLFTTYQFQLYCQQLDFINSNLYCCHFPRIVNLKAFPPNVFFRLPFCLLHHFSKSLHQFRYPRQNFNLHRNVSKQFFGFQIRPLRCLLQRAVLKRTQPY